MFNTKSMSAFTRTGMKKWEAGAPIPHTTWINSGKASAVLASMQPMRITSCLRSETTATFSSPAIRKQFSGIARKLSPYTASAYLSLLNSSLSTQTVPNPSIVRPARALKVCKATAAFIHNENDSFYRSNMALALVKYARAAPIFIANRSVKGISYNRSQTSRRRVGWLRRGNEAVRGPHLVRAPKAALTR